MTEFDRTRTNLLNGQVAESTPGATGATSTSASPPVTGADDPLPRVFGHYELRRLLGSGGMGRVYLAHDPHLDRLVALKMPNPVQGAAGWRERFLAEARAAATLTHPNVCPVHEVGEVDGQPYLTMAFIEGETLAARLERDGPLDVPAAIDLVRTVARAMQEAHRRGIVHRDLKPANVMLDLSGRPVIMDFGLAIRSTNTDDLRLTLTGVALGTPAYMPPEQAGGENDTIGPPADVYSLGVILYKVLTGRVPFQARSFGKLLAQIERDRPPSPSSLRPEVDPALEAIILTALAKSPGDRFTDGGKLAEALDRYQRGDRESLSAQFGRPYRLPEIETLEYKPEQNVSTMLAVPTRSRTGRWLTAGLAIVLLAVLSAAIYVRTDYGDLEVRLSDPNAKVDVRVNGKEVTLEPEGGNPIRVRAGANQKLEISSADFESVAESFDLKRNGTTIVQVTLKPKSPVAKGPAAKDEPIAIPKKQDDQANPKKEPPKPVRFPTSPSKIEWPGWEMLVDAPREKMDEWLAERKKAKHSVMWLDAFTVEGKPVFAAFAALDERQSDWRAFPYLSALEFTDPDRMQKHVDIKQNRLVSLNTFVEPTGPRAALLFHRGNSIWTLGPANTRASLAKVVETGRASGFTMRSLRPFEFGGDHAYATIMEVQPGERSPTFGNDLTPAELDKFLSDYRAKGYRAENVSAYPREGALRFTAVVFSDPKKASWEVHRDLAAAELKAKSIEMAGRGFTLTCVSGYPFDGAVRYVGTWLKEPPKPVEFPKIGTRIELTGWEILADTDQKPMQDWLDARKKAGHSVMWLDVTKVGDKPLYTAIAALDGRESQWTAMLDVPSTTANTIATTRKGVNSTTHWLVSMGTYIQGENFHCAMLWHPGQRRWKIQADVAEGMIKDEERDATARGAVIRVLRPLATGEIRPRYAYYFEVALKGKASYKYGLSLPQLRAFLTEQRAMGSFPRSLSAVSHDNNLEFTAICEPNKDSLEWEAVDSLPANELKLKAADLAKKGFVPRSLTAYPWDGAVRYVGVWVKEAKK